MVSAVLPPILERRQRAASSGQFELSSEYLATTTQIADEWKAFNHLQQRMEEITTALDAQSLRLDRVARQSLGRLRGALASLRRAWQEMSIYEDDGTYCRERFIEAEAAIAVIVARCEAIDELVAFVARWRRRMETPVGAWLEEHAVRRSLDVLELAEVISHVDSLRALALLRRYFAPIEHEVARPMVAVEASMLEAEIRTLQRLNRSGVMLSTGHRFECVAELTVAISLLNRCRDGFLVETVNNVERWTVPDMTQLEGIHDRLMRFSVAQRLESIRGEYNRMIELVDALLSIRVAAAATELAEESGRVEHS